MTEQEIAKRIRSEVAAVDRKYRRLIALKVAELERAEGEGLKAKRTELEALRLEAKREHQRAYWNNRARQYEAAWTQRSKETIERDLKKAYEAGLKEIEESIMKLYNTFSKDNEVSIIKAREILTSSEYRKWRMSLEEYVKNIEAGDKGLELELNTLAMRSRISRLDKLYSETLIELDKIGRESQQRLSLFLDEAYKENYTRNLFDLAKIGGIEIAASAVERISSERVLASRWSGENFSSRIWTDKRKLSNVIKATIVSGIHQGLDIKEMSKRINDVMTSGYNNAVRLIRTEMNFVNNQAAADSFEESGIVYYEFIAVLDNRTSKVCQSRDGEAYPMSEKSVGFNYPPLHPRCRSTVAPYIEGAGRLGTRIAKVNDKRLHVPEDMKYEEFKQKYLTKPTIEDKINSNIELTRKKTDNLNYKAVSEERYQQLTVPLKKMGVTIIRGGEIEKHLDELGAQASNLGTDIVFFRQKISISAILEETHHVRQNRQGLNDDKPLTIHTALNEIDAKEYLLKVAKQYQIPREEIEETKIQLEYYKLELKRLKAERSI